ncbi:MAG: AAA family ATPase [Caldilineaceae bacterium]|nr:AAA family ATPase [Caldilineaceae bacterium]
MSDSTPVLPFQRIAPHLAVGAPPSGEWHSLNSLPLIILVGVTGVGKSTLLNELMQQGAEYLLLPDRRDLTDQLIISHMQALEGLPLAPVTDRGQRFAYTRRYRELYAGGMAHALTQLWISDDSRAKLLLFDGLRGANEVAYAASALPQARFVMLDAPDWVRVQRLLSRDDTFDRIDVSTPGVREADSFAALGLPEAGALFSATEEATLLSWIRRGIVTGDELRAKLQIVIEERRSYDPVETLAALRSHAARATLYIDTVSHDPAAVAAQVLTWLNR